MAAAESRASGHGLRATDHKANTAVPPGVRLLAAAVAAAGAMLIAVLAIAMLSGEYRRVPASGPPFVPGDIADVARIFGRNLLVLALFVMGNVAVSGIQRWRAANETAVATAGKTVGRLALAAVIGLLLLATCRQAYALGHALAGFAGYFYVSVWRVWLAVLPHALLELSGIFLPVAVWLFARREGRERELLALTLSAMVVAVPLLAAAALTEAFVSPKVFRALTCIGESEGFRGGGGACGPEPRECSRLTPREFETRYHIHLSQADIAAAGRRCAVPPGPRHRGSG